ncbi:hypothetical protein AXF42_Ash015150 [Apostasia shenzhenica]|uniref:Uncharacterized protein n=1 Tax=Apostasia shenzhenica TaxID=1088818 RepID=A0A2I0AQE2_9ASPA|nr:hypothetical protein AXF42_Ash015150 [Apostasia shenzhenica]
MSLPEMSTQSHSNDSNNCSNQQDAEPTVVETTVAALSNEEHVLLLAEGDVEVETQKGIKRRSNVWKHLTSNIELEDIEDLELVASLCVSTIYDHCRVKTTIAKMIIAHKYSFMMVEH